MYEEGLEGAFSENELGISRLILAYYQERRFEDVVKITPRIISLPQFAKSKSHILYAASLGQCGQPEKAESEFKKMNGRFGNFEARYYYALFLRQQNRQEESLNLLHLIAEEIPQLSAVEKRSNRQWLNLSREALRR